MDEGNGQPAESEAILGIAEALRAEFGAEIDAHPGGVGNAAGPINRAFRAASRRMLGAGVPQGEGLDAVLRRVLRQVARRRLVGDGIPGVRAETLIDLEPALGDAWYAYLALAPGSVIEDLD